MDETILIAGAGQNQISIIRKAKSLGFRTVAVDGFPDAPGLPFADEKIVADIRNPEVILAVAENVKATAVYPAAEHAVEACAHATSRLNLPGVSPEVAHRVRNKFAMREALAAREGFNPRYICVETLQEAHHAAQMIGFPVIVKPVDGNASRGVRRVESLEDLDEAFGLASQVSNKGDVLIESYLEGEEYNVDGLVFNGRYIPGAVTGKIRSPLPYRYDEAIFTPGADPELEDRIFSTVASALQCIGFSLGTTHIEVIVTPKNVYIVEMAGRPGGGRIPSDLIPLAYGMDYLADSLRIAAGKQPTSKRLFRKGSVLLWLKAKPGIVREIRGVEQAAAVPGVHDIWLQTSEGKTIPRVVDCATRDKIGYVIAAGNTVDEAFSAAHRAAEKIEIITTAEHVPI